MRTLDQAVAELKMMFNRKTQTREEKFLFLHSVLLVVENMNFPDKKAFEEKRQMYKTEE